MPVFATICLLVCVLCSATEIICRLLNSVSLYFRLYNVPKHLNIFMLYRYWNWWDNRLFYVLTASCTACTTITNNKNDSRIITSYWCCLRETGFRGKGKVSIILLNRPLSAISNLYTLLLCLFAGISAKRAVMWQSAWFKISCINK